MIHTRILIIGAILAIAVSLPFYSRTWHLLMHQAGSIIFLGNIIVSALWMSIAKRSGSVDGFRLGVRGLMLTDAVFTTPGALLLLLNGGILGTDFFSSGGNWLFISMTMFLVTVIIAHIYIGTIGMEGAFDAMGSGHVDANWAREHHSVWVAELERGGERPLPVEPAHSAGDD